MIVTTSNPISWIARALRTGETSLLPGKLPAYTRLDAATKEAAVRRGVGRTTVQPFSNGDAAGTDLEEPVNLIVKGPLPRLQATLEQAGWVEAQSRSLPHYLHTALSALFKLGNYNGAPVSQQFLDGRGEALALNKNSDHNRARDHLRVYALPADPVTGEQRWGIAATRDIALSLTTKGHVDLGHAIDYGVDGERDQIMADLLRVGVKQWAAVRGVRPQAKDVQVPGGVLAGGKYLTDGLVYEVSLTSR
ncbi:MAG: hypothetical protein JWM80_6330 [Cyanobacteria bacterium RYN_339]|nr:hypothetical protein [Cyanobacteria bacterium RYN_339]